MRLVFAAMLILMLASCAATHKGTSPGKLPKKGAEPLRNDLILLQKILEANHPSLYWYTPKDSMDLYFRTAINGIHDSLDEVQFRTRVAWVLSRIRCGHTNVFPSKRFNTQSAQYRFPSFPLYLKAWGDSLVVMDNLFPKDSRFKRGTIITGINGRSNREILDSIYQFFSSDGYAFNHKAQVVSGNFPVWYKNIFGVSRSYSVSYIDSNGLAAVDTLVNFVPLRDTTRRKKNTPATTVKKPSRREIRRAKLEAKRMMVIDTATQTAIIRLTTFSSGGLRRFFRRSFRKIRDEKLQHLVIDLRENGGGKVSNSILLTQYLADHPFKVGDTVMAKSRKFAHGRYIHPVIEYWLAMNLGSRKMEDGMIHYRRYERKWFEPKTRYHFSGPVVLLQGGYTFSASTLFIGQLKGQKNVTIAGEESGGGYYGSSALYLPTITLPASKLRISLPMYRLVSDGTRPRGRGIMPDLPIPPSSQAIRQGRDGKLSAVRTYLQALKP